MFRTQREPNDALRGRVGVYPTPVEVHTWVEEGEPRRLWVKRDDCTHARYGGNKVRKLERILVAARGCGKTRIFTIGAAGSHHVLATAVHGGEVGLDVIAALVPQPFTPHALRNLKASLALGATLIPCRSIGKLAWPFVRHVLDRRTFYVPVGGSSYLGALGYVDAAFELADQVRAGKLPEPDDIVVALGSGGTFAGLAAGLAAAGLASRVHGIVVADPSWAIPWAARYLLARMSLAARRDPRALRPTKNARPMVHIDVGYLGRGYGHPTAEGMNASALAATWGFSVDPTYTAKTLAAGLDLVRASPRKTVLYWHTLSGGNIDSLVALAPMHQEVPPELRRLLT